MAPNDVGDAAQEGSDRRRRWWRRRAWWRVVALVYAGVAAVGTVPILEYAVSYWQPCFDTDYDSAACLAIQDHDVAGAFTYAAITADWLIVTVAAVVTAVLCLLARAPRVLVVGVPLLAIVVNPVGDYFLTPLVNGGYLSHDAHPASGVPMGAGMALSAVLATVAALTLGRRGSRQPQDERTVSGRA